MSHTYVLMHIYIHHTWQRILRFPGVERLLSDFGAALSTTTVKGGLKPYYLYRPKVAPVGKYGGWGSEDGGASKRRRQTRRWRDSYKAIRANYVSTFVAVEKHEMATEEVTAETTTTTLARTVTRLDKFRPNSLSTAADSAETIISSAPRRRPPLTAAYEPRGPVGRFRSDTKRCDDNNNNMMPTTAGLGRVYGRWWKLIRKYNCTRTHHSRGSRTFCALLNSAQCINNILYHIVFDVVSIKARLTASRFHAAMRNVSDFPIVTFSRSVQLFRSVQAHT